MPQVPVYNMEGQEVETLSLPEDIFGLEVNEGLLHEIVTIYQARQRVGTASTKTRAEVRGGGRKPWRQKGTGRARHGTIRSPIWTGGGITFGPKPREFNPKLSKNKRRAGLKQALSAKVRDNELVMLDALTVAEPKTKEVARTLSNLNLSGISSLIVTNGTSDAVYKSARNIPGVEVRRAEELNAYDILRHKALVLTKEGLAKVEEVFS